MTSLPDRYGAPSPVRRRLALGAVGLLVGAGIVWLAWATWFHATPAVSSEPVGFEVVDANTATAVVQVDLADGVEATCRLRAYAADHVTVGEVAFSPVDGRNEIALRTEREATSVTLLGCTAPGQPRPR